MCTHGNANMFVRLNTFKNKEVLYMCSAAMACIGYWLPVCTTVYMGSLRIPISAALSLSCTDKTSLERALTGTCRGWFCLLYSGM